MKKPNFRPGMAVVFMPRTFFDATYYAEKGLVKGTPGTVDTIVGFHGRGVWADPMRQLVAVNWELPSGDLLMGTDWKSVSPVTASKKTGMSGIQKGEGITLFQGDYGTFEIVHDDGRNILIQTDWDFPGLARSFGWVPKKSKGCTHEGTDGTVKCPGCGKTASAFIEEARQYLDDHEGKRVADPGYFQ